MGIILQTRKGRKIENEVYPELPRLHYKNNDIQLKNRYLNVKLRSRGTNRYNCHGLTFANRRTFIADASELKKIFEDDEYKKICKGEARVGDIIVYLYNEDIEHTGIIIEIENFLSSNPMPIILSKWGAAGEFIHKYNECPYFDHCDRIKIEFWTERKTDD